MKQKKTESDQHMRRKKKKTVSCAAQKSRRRIAALLLALCVCLPCFCGCGKTQQASSASEVQPAPFIPSGSETESTPALTEPITSPSAESRPESTADGPEEDPWAEGYFYDEELTAALFAAFAVENTNNTDISSPARSVTAELLQQLNEAALAWFYDGVSDRETEEAMKQFSGRFPDDPPGTARRMQSVKAAVYRLNGSDPEMLRARILLGNTEACFYLFLRAYYSEAENRTRVYMINGLIW